MPSGFDPTDLPDELMTLSDEETNDWNGGNVSWAKKTPLKVKSWWTTRSSSSCQDMLTESNVFTARKKNNKKQLIRKYDDDETAKAAEEKKRRLRERNRMAVAKYRQSVVDLTSILIAESDALDQEQNDLENEIEVLKKQKEHLECLMLLHRPLCKIKNKPNFVDVVSTTSSSNTHVMVEQPEMCTVRESHVPGTVVSYKPTGRANSLLSSQEKALEHTIEKKIMD